MNRQFVAWARNTPRAMHQQLTAYLTAHFPFSAAELQTVLPCFALRRTKRNESLLTKGEVCRHVYFVNQGCLRAFYLQPDGHEATRYVAFENQFGTALKSFITRQSALEFLQTVEASELLAIAHADFYRLLATVPAWAGVYAAQLEGAYLVNTWRLESFITLDARQRYEDLLQTNPHIVRRLSNRLVASYLGITPESLSRLKAR